MASPTKPRIRVAYSVLPVGALYFHCENQDIPPVRKTCARRPHEPDFYAWIEPVIAPPAEEPTTPAPHLVRVHYSDLAVYSVYYESPNGGVAYNKLLDEDKFSQKMVYAYLKPESIIPTGCSEDAPKVPAENRKAIPYCDLKEGDTYYREASGSLAYVKSYDSNGRPKIEVYVTRKPDSEEDLVHDTEAPVRDRKRVQYGTLTEGARFYLGKFGGIEWIRGTAQDELDTRVIWAEGQRNS